MAEHPSGFILGGAIVTHHELQAQHVYLANQLEEVKQRQNAILIFLRDIFASGNGKIIPALEAKINEVHARSRKIDEKVPDLKPPDPGTTPPQT